MFVYISGPYSGPTLEDRLANTEYAIHFYLVLIQKGYTPFCPHLTHFAHEYGLTKGIEIDYEEWMRQDLLWVEKCDVLLRLGPSPGANRERDHAINLLKPVFDSLDALLETYGDPYRSRKEKDE